MKAKSSGLPYQTFKIKGVTYQVYRQYPAAPEGSCRWGVFAKGMNSPGRWLNWCGSIFMEDLETCFLAILCEVEGS